MRPSDRSIRDVLRREAANVPIPDDMWKNISQRLDEDSVRQERKKRGIAGSHQWRPALILAVAAGFFWFALIPTLPEMGTAFPAESISPPVVQSAGQPDPFNDPKAAKTPVPTQAPTKQTRRDGDAVRTTAAAEVAPSAGVFPGPVTH